MDILTIIIALAFIFIAWKVLMGLIRFGVIVLVLAAAAWIVAGGGFA